MPDSHSLIIEKATELPLLILVDDDQHILNALERVLRNVKAEIVSFTSVNKALFFCQNHKPEIIISDQHMPEMDGCDFLAKMQEQWPNSQRIILSAYQDFQKISAAFNAGTVERFICKPWDNREINFIINKALDVKPIISTENSSHEKALINTPINFHGIIAADDAMKDLCASIRHAATTNAPIFITGETGTGKELVAHACHKESFNKEQPFIAVNCANFSENLMESQLFGHVKGAFTGALASQEGLFAAAKHGTLFLDEITTMTKPLQAKLLRVVQEREFTPLGTNKVQQFHAQLISASSSSIGESVANGEFREDLYYRLNVITFDLPPLRERGSDVILVARYFLKKYVRIENKHFTCFSKDALQIICQYDWPGNIRQLENTIHGMVVLNKGPEITTEMIIKSLSRTVSGFQLEKHKQQNQSPAINMMPANSSHYSDAPPANTRNNIVTVDSNSIVKVTENTIQPLWQVEKQTIETAIAYCHGNIPKAAALLEVSPSTIYRKKQQWS